MVVGSWVEQVCGNDVGASADFMEALARASDMVTLPSVADIQAAQVSGAYEFFTKSRRSGITGSVLNGASP